MDQVIVNGIVVAVHESEPSIKDLDLAIAAGLSKPRDIRATIAGLIKSGDIQVSKNQGNTDAAAAGVNPNQTKCWVVQQVVASGKKTYRTFDTYYLNRQATLKVIMNLRTPRAKEVQDQMVNVFVAYQDRLLVSAAHTPALPPPPPALPVAVTETAPLAVVDHPAALRWEIESERALRLRLIEAYTMPRIEQIFGLDYVKRHVEQEFSRLSERSADVTGPKAVLLSNVLLRAGYPKAFVEKNESTFGRYVAPKYRTAHNGAEPPKVEYKNAAGIWVEKNEYTENDRAAIEAALAEFMQKYPVPAPPARQLPGVNL